MEPSEQRQLVESEALKTTAEFSDKELDATEFYVQDDHATANDRRGAQIGNYVLTNKLGQGGFGTVWKAEQLQPVRRHVAIKILKLGMDSREVVARFAQERQALAMMEHPGIAKVLDAGITQEGRPYFVMELVQGSPLTHYCNSKGLGIQERLELFIQLCTAVHHAHLKGIVHRDLKPSNILVYGTEHGHAVKIIDFGVAKATAGSLTDITMHTQLGQFMGTPAYMSPEQADGLVYDIDMRADVYSLGVVLYELLTCELPFDLSKVNRNYDALRKLIREQVPRRPSSRLRGCDPKRAAKVSELYRGDFSRIEQAIRGDLDWIIMKALEKAPSSRYDTAHEFALDIRRHLAKEPVVARPPSTRYLLSRFVARHRIGVLAASLILLTLLAATLISTRMFFNELAARREADAESARARQMVSILTNMVLAAGPSVAQGRDTALMKDLLKTTVEDVEKNLSGQPETELEIRKLIAQAYGDIGDFDQALAMHLRVVELQRKLFPNDYQQLADSLANLASSLDSADRLADAENALREAITIRQKVVPRPVKSIAYDRELLAWLLERRGDLSHSEVEARQALQDYTGSDTDALSFRAQTLMTLGVSLMKLAKFSEAEQVHREALDIYRKINDKPHPDTVTAINNLCHMLCELGEFDEVEKLADEGIELERLLDGEPIGVCTDAFYKALSHVHAHRRDYAKAIDSLKFAIKAATQMYGADHRFTNDKRALLIEYQIDAEQLDDAAVTLAEAKSVGGDGTSADNSLVLAEARLLFSSGQFEQARVLARSDLARAQAESLEPSLNQLKAMYLLAQIEARLGNLVEAHELIDAAQAILKSDEQCESIICQRIAELRRMLTP